MVADRRCPVCGGELIWERGRLVCSVCGVVVDEGEISYDPMYPEDERSFRPSSPGFTRLDPTRPNYGLGAAIAVGGAAARGLRRTQLFRTSDEKTKAGMASARVREICAFLGLPGFIERDAAVLARSLVAKVGGPYNLAAGAAVYIVLREAQYTGATIKDIAEAAGVRQKKLWKYISSAFKRGFKIRAPSAEAYLETILSEMDRIEVIKEARAALDDLRRRKAFAGSNPRNVAAFAILLALSAKLGSEDAAIKELERAGIRRTTMRRMLEAYVLATAR